MSPERRLKALRAHAGRLLLSAQRLVSSCNTPEIASLPTIAPLKARVASAMEDLNRSLTDGNTNAAESSISNLDHAIHALATELREALESLLPKSSPSS